jgi:hypothetical protein
MKADKRTFFLNVAHLIHFNTKVQGETNLVLTNNTSLTVVNTPDDIMALIEKG